MEGLPIEEQRGGRGSGKLEPLGTFAIGIEDEAALVGALQENHAHIRRALGVHRGEHHGVRVDGLMGHRIRHPAGEKGERLFRAREIRLLRARAGWLVDWHGSNGPRDFCSVPARNGHLRFPHSDTAPWVPLIVDAGL